MLWRCTNIMCWLQGLLDIQLFFARFCVTGTALRGGEARERTLTGGKMDSSYLGRTNASLVYP